MLQLFMHPHTTLRYVIVWIQWRPLQLIMRPLLSPPFSRPLQEANGGGGVKRGTERHLPVVHPAGHMCRNIGCVYWYCACVCVCGGRGHC